MAERGGGMMIGSRGRSRIPIGTTEGFKIIKSVYPKFNIECKAVERNLAISVIYKLLRCVMYLWVHPVQKIKIWHLRLRQSLPTLVFSNNRSLFWLFELQQFPIRVCALCSGFQTMSTKFAASACNRVEASQNIADFSLDPCCVNPQLHIVN